MPKTSIISSRRAAAALLTAMMAFGCSDTSTGPRTRGPQGTYTLRQVGQKAVPAEIHHGPWFDPVNHHFYNQIVVTVTAGAIELETDGEFVVWIDYDVLADGAAARKRTQIEGTYSVNGSQVVLYVEGTGSESITVDSGSIVEPMDLMQEGRLFDYTFRR